jgi:transcriptional regulator with XRE-family HTH domain
VSRRPIPPHGSYARANGSPGYRSACNCEPCRTTRLRTKKRNRVNRQLGRPGLIDATPARRRLEELQRTMSWLQIKAATGCDDCNLRQILDGTRSQIRRDTLDRILSIQPEEPAPGKYLDATGTRRRLQALRAIGWSARAIAEAAGAGETSVERICNGQPAVRAVVAAKIRKVYETLSQTPAPASRSASRAKGYAAAHGWPPPAAWDDDEIDDPTAQAHLAIALNFHERAQLRREEIEHLAWCGHEPEQILDRLNGEVSISTVRQIVQEWRTGVKRDRKQVAA